MKNTFRILCGIAIFILLASCNLFIKAKNPVETYDKGTLLLSFQASSKTLLPEGNLSIDSFDLILTKTGSNPIEKTGIDSHTTDLDPIVLQIGTWTVTVNGRNAEGELVATGTATAVISPAASTSVTVNIRRLAGDGIFSLSAGINEGVAILPSIHGELLRTDNGEAIEFDMTIAEDGKSASYENTAIPAGWYTLTISLEDKGQVIARSEPEAVLIAEGRRTSGPIKFLFDPNLGRVVIQIALQLDDPIAIQFNDLQNTINEKQTMTVSVTTSESVNHYRWYLDNAEVQGETQPSITINGSIGIGNHRLSIVVDTANKVASASTFFTVLPMPAYQVIYDGNGQTSGFPPVDTNEYKEGDSVIVKGNEGNLAKTDWLFNGWNTMADGSGKDYQAGETFSMGSSNITLYAKWKWLATKFKIANSWGIGNGWEHVPDGFLWMTDGAMKKANIYATFYENLDNYMPRYVIRFSIRHSNRNNLEIHIGMGQPGAAIKDEKIFPFSDAWGENGNFPMNPDTVTIDLTDWQDDISLNDIYMVVSDTTIGETGQIINARIEQYSDYGLPPVKVISPNSSFPVSIPDPGSTTLSFKTAGNMQQMHQKKYIAKKSKIESLFTTRSLSSSEIFNMKSRIGVRKPGQNYNKLINNHGTGLAPPTEEEWELIELYGKTIESLPSRSKAKGIPSQCDLSLDAAFPPIGNQGSLGSCAIFSTAYYIKTYQEAKEHGWDLSSSYWTGNWPGYLVGNLEKIMSPKFIYNLINGGIDEGASYYNAIHALSRFGCSSWQNFPYDTDYLEWPNAIAWQESPLYRGKFPDPSEFGTFYWLFINDDKDIETLCRIIDAGIPVSISVDADKYSLLTSEDLWDESNYIDPKPNHANTVVGYVKQGE